MRASREAGAARSQRRTALFYDAPLSTAEDVALVKAMLLFFDDIAVFSPATQRSHPPHIDLHLSAPLAERRLLQFVAPRDVTRSHTELTVRATLLRSVVGNAERRPASTELVRMSESPAFGEPGSLDLFRLLAEDGVLFPDESTYEQGILVPGFASVANSILAQAIRSTASQEGWLLEPVATRRDEARVFTAILEDAVENVGAADVVGSDLSAVTVDLAKVDVDDILDFRARHRREFRAHLVALHAFAASPPTAGNLADRRAALVEEAHRLRELQRRRWPAPGAGVSLGVIGATWPLASGDLLGALIGTAASPLLAVGPPPVSAYTYILRPEPEPDSGSHPADTSPTPAGELPRQSSKTDQQISLRKR